MPVALSRAARAAAPLALLFACSAEPARAPAPPAAPPGVPASASTAAPAPAREPRQLGADTTVSTPSGASFLAAKGWWLVEGAELIVLEDPDRTLKATLVERPEPDAKAAIAASWARARPGLARGPEGEPESPPPEGGWDAITSVDYGAGPAGGPIARAIARRYGGRTYVALIEGDATAFSRRGAQLDTALSTLRPRGMQDESFAGKAPRPIDAARAAELDAFIADALAKLEVPGAAVAVVLGGAVVYEHSFGVRTIGKAGPVTPSTLFMIGSVTKPMTTLMQAALVDAGKFGWDTPVTKVLPSFALGDERVTAELAMWHTSCACTGMPRRDLENLFEYDGVTPERRLASMKEMRPTTALGETYQYSNLMVMAGGYAAARAFDPRRPLGDAYDAAMRAHVFGPVGMASTTLDFAAAERAEHASPHALDVDGAPRPVLLSAERNVLPIRPAGGVWSNLRDMERYALTELSKGLAPGGRRVASEANVVERWKLRVRDGDGEDGGYGLGMGVGTYRGIKALSHDGGSHGFGATLYLLPELDAGIVILTNVRNGGDFEQLPFNAAVRRRLLETLFEGAKPLAAAQIEYFARAKRAASARVREGLERRPDPGWAKGLEGAYAEPNLGKVRVRVGPAGGTFDVGEWKSSFGRRRQPDGGTTLVLLDVPFAGGEFVVGGDPRRPTLSVRYGQTSYVFERASN